MKISVFDSNNGIDAKHERQSLLYVDRDITEQMAVNEGHVIIEGPDDIAMIIDNPDGSYAAVTLTFTELTTILKAALIDLLE